MRAAWTLLAIVAVLWPGRAIGALDGVPLDGPVEATLLGVAVPSLLWLTHGRTPQLLAKALIVALLVVKAIGAALLTQQGLCVTTTARAPINAINQGVPIVEPMGLLRSWDARAGVWADAPQCTAIFARPWATTPDLPAWFVNVTDQILRRRDFMMTVRGAITIDRAQQFTLAVGEDMTASGSIGGRPLSDQPVSLAAGTHAVDLTLTLTGDRWKVEPRLDGAPLWNRALVTVAPPTAADRMVGRWYAAPATLGVVVLVLTWIGAMWPRLRGDVPVLVAGMLLATAAVVCATAGSPLSRAAGLVGFLALLVPASYRVRNLRGAFLLVGVPWLAFVAALGWAQAGRFSIYSYDDWLTYQVAGYRIYMHGYWLEGGNEVFDFQPLYRWITGALHLVFGDSSVGELYADAACLLLGALLAFHLIQRTSGFRWGLAAAAATLATFTLGTPWYFIGRGLSEIAAAGLMFAAIFLMLRGRRGRMRWVATSGVAAILMFYTRLNHLLLAGFLPLFLLSRRVPATPAAVAAALKRIPVDRAAVFLGLFGGGVVAFMARTWYYTGTFSLFLGTSLRHNDTGLRPWTMLDGEVWSKVAHSLAATIWMNEPPHADPRAVFMVIGAAVVIGALAQVPRLREVPALAVIGALAGVAGAFVAHAHGYPGRFSIHIVPFACALSMAGAAQVLRARVAR